jgi:uracil phosphoribosyltransferase
MKIVDFSESNSVVNKFLSELRDVSIQADRAKFRRNLQRIGQMMAYEISKTLSYSVKEVATPLGVAKVSTHDDDVVLATIFRAGLPFHQGFLDVFDDADNAFVSAYRYYKDDEHEDVAIKVEYLAAPDLTGRTLIVADPMLATGGSMELGLEALCTKGGPASIHLCSVIASRAGVEYIRKCYGDCENVTLWCGAIDDTLNEHAYIVPGLGDAGDLAFGGKL